MTPYISYDLRRQVTERANFICEYCLLHDDESHFGGELDHIISRVIRGGSWYNNAVICRSARRGHGAPGGRGVILGFRLVRIGR